MSKLAAAVVLGTETRVVHSEAADRDYLISVALPFHYEDHPDRVWPTIYVLDANLYFGMVVDMVRAMNIRVEICNELPDAFVVGVGYPTSSSPADALHQTMHRRLRDFLPTRELESEDFIQSHFPVDAPAISGDAAGFHAFIATELIPLLESNYRVDRLDRTLLGHSWGGDFVFNSLFRDPGLFSRYVAVSTAPDPIQEEAYAAEHASLPVRLHCVTEDGDPAGPSTLRATVARLESRSYEGLRLSYAVLPGTTHCAVVPAAFASGLTAVFSRDHDRRTGSSSS